MAKTSGVTVQPTVREQDLDATEICRPDTPSTISETASGFHENASALKLLDESFTTQPRLSDSISSTLQPTKARSSVYRGVCWNKKNKRWQSAINNGGRYVYLGSFVEEIEAAKAFDLAALQIRGKGTKLNFNIEDYPESEWKHGTPSHLVEKYRPAKPGVSCLMKTANGRTRLEPFAFQGFKVDPNRLRNFEELLGRRRSRFAFAEQEFFRDSVSSLPSISIKKECEPFDIIPGIPSTQDILITKPTEISCVKPIEQKSDHDRLEDSADPTEGKYPGGPGGKRGSENLLNAKEFSKKQCINVGLSNQESLPVPALHQPHVESRYLQVSNVLPKTIENNSNGSSGGNIEAAKLFVGSSRNYFGLIHHTTNQAKWSSLVWDGDTMHDMGIYATENDAQVACVAAVQLVEAIIDKKS